MHGPVGPPLIHSTNTYSVEATQKTASVLRGFGFCWPDTEQLKIAPSRSSITNLVTLKGAVHSQDSPMLRWQCPWGMANTQFFGHIIAILSDFEINMCTEGHATTMPETQMNMFVSSHSVRIYCITNLQGSMIFFLTAICHMVCFSLTICRGKQGV